jgi:hypothetical protein
MSDFEGVDWLETSSKPVTPNKEVAPMDRDWET